MDNLTINSHTGTKCLKIQSNILLSESIRNPLKRQLSRFTKKLILSKSSRFRQKLVSSRTTLILTLFGFLITLKQRSLFICVWKTRQEIPYMNSLKEKIKSLKSSICISKLVRSQELLTQFIGKEFS